MQVYRNTEIKKFAIESGESLIAKKDGLCERTLNSLRLRHCS